MSSRFVAVRYEALDPVGLGAFWAAVLGRDVIEEDQGVLLPGDETQIGLRFVKTETGNTGRHRLHLHLTSDSEEHQRRTVETVLSLGGRRYGTKPLPMGDDIYLEDPGGNEFCVIEPGNGYLEGTGFLGEFTCDGSREVGLFWSDALGWPVVWDQGDQVAIQSPLGGTKIGWDRWPEKGSDRHQFDLAASDPSVEAARLVTLGATLVDASDDGIGMLDPDGYEFSITLDPDG